MRIFPRATAVVLALCGISPAAAYIGPSYLLISGVDGSARENDFDGWVRAEANYWTQRPVLPEIRGAASQKNDLLFTGPLAPVSGPEMLAISIAKSNPDLASLMKRCHSGEIIPEVTYAEAAELARHPQEHSPRPASVPAYYEFRLKNVRMSCPVVASAPEQAFSLHFEEIEWLNYHPHTKPLVTTAPVVAPPVRQLSGGSMVFAMTWFAAAVDASANQCVAMNRKPSADDYFRLLPPAMAAEEMLLEPEGSVGPDRMSFRGPDQMHVGLLPGVVADPGHILAKADKVPGFDLDGADSHDHPDFISLDGRTGIDNQLFTVEGCVEGFRRKGFLPMIFNESRVGGRPTALIEISGIDDRVNDDAVDVTVYFSTDTLRRSPADVILTDYTYRVTEDPEFAQDVAYFPAKIIEGTIVTDVADSLHIHEVLGIETTIYKPRLRLEMLADGSLKGLVGGYVDWRKRYLWQSYRAADYENTIGFQAPAIYNAMKRAADGMLNAVTGEYDGISAAFEIEAVPAFLPPSQSGHQTAHADTSRPEKK